MGRRGRTRRPGRPPSPPQRSSARIPSPPPSPINHFLSMFLAAASVAAASVSVVTAATTTLFGGYGTILSGNLDVTDAILEGPSLVMGKATLDNFVAGGGAKNESILEHGNGSPPTPLTCESPLHALAVVGRTTAKRGAIVGRAVLGAKSAVANSVHLACAADAAAAAAAAVPQGAVVPAAAQDGWEVFGATGGVDISPLRTTAATATATLCDLPATGTVTRVGSTIHLYPRGPAAHRGMAGIAGVAGIGNGGVPGGNATCFDVFRIDLPRDADNEMRYYGVGRPLLLYRLRRSGVRWSAMDMGHLDAGRTLHVVCKGGGSRLDVTGSVLRGGLLAPALHLAMVNSEMAGRLVAEHLRGSGVRLRYEEWEGLAAADVKNILC
ncbi:hypothetical protein MMPV_002642 [Pyropia vietnamensis]